MHPLRARRPSTPEGRRALRPARGCTAHTSPYATSARRAVPTTLTVTLPGFRCHGREACGRLPPARAARTWSPRTSPAGSWPGMFLARSPEPFAPPLFPLSVVDSTRACTREAHTATSTTSRPSLRLCTVTRRSCSSSASSSAGTLSAWECTDKRRVGLKRFAQAFDHVRPLRRRHVFSTVRRGQHSVHKRRRARSTDDLGRRLGGPEPLGIAAVSGGVTGTACCRHWPVVIPCATLASPARSKPPGHVVAKKTGALSRAGVRHSGPAAAEKGMEACGDCSELLCQRTREHCGDGTQIGGSRRYRRDASVSVACGLFWSCRRHSTDNEHRRDRQH